MVVIPTGSRSIALLYERQLSVKRFIPGSVLLGYPLILSTQQILCWIVDENA